MPFALGFLAVAVLLVMLASVSIWQERVRQHERAAAGTQNLAHLLEAHVADAMTQADVVLAAVAVQVRDAAGRDTSGRDPVDATAPALRALAAAAPDLLNLRLADAGGRWRPRPGAEPPGPAGGPAEREEFQRARADPAAGLIITGPQRHSPGAPWVLVLSRGILDAGGRFAGLVSIDLPITRFDALFSAIDLGEQGAAAIRTDSLALVYRRPWTPDASSAVGSTEVSAALREAIAANPLAGEFEAATALDGIRRISTYRKVGNYPLILLLGLPEDDFPRGWNAVDIAILALAVATLGAAALAAVGLHRAGQRALDSARQRLAAIVESSQDAIVSESLGGVITSWNPGAEQMYGYSAAEMLGQSLQRLVPPDRREELDDLLVRVHRGERVAHFETERLCHDGRRIPVSISISPVVDADGRIVGVSRIARDITLQKAMAEELRQLAFHDPLTRLPHRPPLLDR
ncbi:MAG: PAS domain S-box protein, partial [Microbacteriaceae bacterium]|nr:PAS domain S-box protein [Burkholderiaceae bacterium]